VPAWFLARDEESLRLFQTHQEAGMGGWRVVKSRHFDIVHAFD
jgi:hypothetical protein